MGRKPLSPDEKARRIKARRQSYYEAHREELLQKAKEKYDPEKKRQYHQAHSEEVKASQRRCNIKRTHTENYELIKGGLKALEDNPITLTDAVKKYLDCGVRLMKDDALTLLRLFEALQ
jgi:hypothetical protein